MIKILILSRCHNCNNTDTVAMATDTVRWCEPLRLWVVPWDGTEEKVRVEVDNVSEREREVDAGHRRDVQVSGGRVVVDAQEHLVLRRVRHVVVLTTTTQSKQQHSTTTRINK